MASRSMIDRKSQREMVFSHQNLLIRLLSILATLTFIRPASGVPWGECDPVVHSTGVNIQNCSGIDLIQLPETVPEEVEIFDFSHNRFTELPHLPESKECHEEANCQVINTTNHCRLEISFSSNEIYKFHDHALHGLRCLQSLDLSFNQIKAEIFHPNSFQEGVYHLQKLDLHGNPLGSLPGNVIAQPFMPDLRELDLSQCQLANISKDSVDSFGELQILNLSNNKLKDIHRDTFKGLLKLHTLDLSHNQLEHFPEHVFGDLGGLKMIFLSDNKITGFHRNAFYNDSNLLTMILRNNQLISIPYTAVDKLPKLHTLNLSENPIQDVSRGSGQSSVKNLVLDNTDTLTTLGPHALASFPALFSLSISGNKRLKVIHSKMLGHTSTTLKHVRLENNGLMTLSTDAFPWRQLESMKLGGNPWFCDDRLRWMVEASCIQGPVICAEPLKLKGRDIKTLNPDELTRIYSIRSATAVVLVSVLLPVFGVCAVLVWKRRRHCSCAETRVKGRYVSVFTRDMDEDGEQRVAIELKVNVNRLKAVSNGDADDTKPFIKVQEGEEKNEEEEI